MMSDEGKVITFVPKAKAQPDWIDAKIAEDKANFAMIVEAFARAGITLDPAASGDWAKIFEATGKLPDDCLLFTLEQRLIQPWGVSPHDKRQDSKSRKVVENLSDAISGLRHAVKEWSQAVPPEGGNSDDLKVDVADRLAHNLSFRSGIRLKINEGTREDSDYVVVDINNENRAHFADRVHILESLNDQLTKLEESVAQALTTGVPPRKGDAQAIAPYSSFADVLREVWEAKMPGVAGYGRSKGSWEGTFVTLVAECEFVLPKKFHPPTESARGKRLATHFNWTSKAGGPTKHE